MERRWVEIDPTSHRRYGMQAEIARLTGIKRQTMQKWFSGRGEPDLRRLAAVSELLQVSRADLLAAFDGTPRDQAPPEILPDGERRLRRKWWLQVARLTAGLGLEAAREELAARGYRSSRGNLVTLWEDFGNRLEPDAGHLRALAAIYRIPLERMVELWNNPPASDEERLAFWRGGRLEAVTAREAERSEPERRRRTA
jgi:transcriptional regulator with XRE-family HTH domain